MTRFGIGVALVGVLLGVSGWFAHWPPLLVLGAGLVVLVGGAAIYVARDRRVAIERAVEPPRVEKGLPAITVIHATNLSRRTLAPMAIEQRLGDMPIRAILPRLRRGEAGQRAYWLPTTKRGIYEIGPIEIPRADPFGLFHTVQKLGTPQRIAVHPRLLPLRPLTTGSSRNLEGPSSDLSPQGSITFNRLREYEVGDDLRNVHWPSTARVGKLVVRNNVDTAQSYTVVLTDLHPNSYSAETFEEAVDVAASVVTSLGAGKAPVQLRLTSGSYLGGPAQRETYSLVDRLTEVVPDDRGSLTAELMLLRRDRGGTALVVVTGRLDRRQLPTIASLRRRYDHVVVASISTETGPVLTYPGLVILLAETAEGLARVWNLRELR